MFDTNMYRDDALYYNDNARKTVKVLCDEIDCLQSTQPEAQLGDTTNPHFSCLPGPQHYDANGEPYHLALSTDGEIWLIEGSTMRPITVEVDEPIDIHKIISDAKEAMDGVDGVHDVGDVLMSQEEFDRWSKPSKK